MGEQDQPGRVTKLLRLSAEGDDQAKDDLFRLIYDDLHNAAHRVLQKKSGGEFQTTELVHESMLRFQDNRVLEKYSKNRRVFFSVATRAMQQVMIDHFRRRSRNPISSASFMIIDQAIQTTESKFGVPFDVLADALNWLQQESPRQHAALVHRFFGGLTVSQTADLLDVSEGTIERDCRIGRARLLHRLGEDLHE